jgi:uncharacterized protein
LTDPWQPRAQDLPAEFPVFPLAGALLLPGGKLPLNIFEPRYLAMVEDSLGAGRMFGMIQPDFSRPSDATGPALYQIGCLGRLSSFSETEDGRYLITLTGLIRFEVGEELGLTRGYRRIRGSFGRFGFDLDDPAPQGLGAFRDALLAELRAYFERNGLKANWEAIGCLPDDMLLVSLSMACPFEPAEKQALLQAPTCADRARVLLALLQMGGMSTHDDVAGRIAS